MTGGAGKTARAVGPLGYLVCLTGFLLCVVAFYPGYMSEDSYSQLTQGRAWTFTDWHPPLMSALWGLIDRVVPGPFGMLVLHNAAFWGALALFWRATHRRASWLGLGLFGCAFLPPVLALLSTVWKDVGHGVSLLMASALLYTARREGSRGALLASVPFLFYGFGVRLNAAPSILPLALWTGLIAARLFAPPGWRAARGRALPLALGLVYFLALSAAVIASTRALTRGQSTYVLQVVLLHDLSAISLERGAPLFPEYILRDADFSMEKVSNAYTPYLGTPIRGQGMSGLNLTEDPEKISALRAKWLEVVPENKATYLRHRWQVFKTVIGFNEEYVCLPYQMGSYAHGYPLNEWGVHRLLRALFLRVKDTFLFRGFFWLLASCGLLYFALRGRLRGDMELVFVLALSGLLYGGAYFFFAPSCDFRFSWWVMLSSLVSLCFLVSHAFGQWRGAGAEGAGGGRPAPANPHGAAG